MILLIILTVIAVALVVVCVVLIKREIEAERKHRPQREEMDRVLRSVAASEMTDTEFLTWLEEHRTWEV